MDCFCISDPDESIDFKPKVLKPDDVIIIDDDDDDDRHCQKSMSWTRNCNQARRRSFCHQVSPGCRSSESFLLCRSPPLIVLSEEDDLPDIAFDASSSAREIKKEKKMEVAMKCVTIKTDQYKPLIPPPHEQNASPQLMRAFIMDSDDELPDLEPEVKYSPALAIDDLMTCTCAKTAGRTPITCLKCRLSGEPPAKKVRTDRHFMDSLITPKGSNIEGSDYNSDDGDTLDFGESSESDSSLYDIDISRPVGRKVKVTRNERTKKYEDKSVKVSSQTSVAEVRHVHKKCTPHPSYFPIPSHPRCPLGETKIEVQQFSEPKVGIVEAIFEEESCNTSMIFRATKVIDSFTTEATEPTNDIVAHLLQSMLNSNNERLTYSIYNYLHWNIINHPPFGGLPFEWALLEKIMETLRLPYGLKNVGHLTALNNILTLKIINAYIEAELNHRTMASQQRVVRSVAYKWLSIEGNYHNVKQVIKWITQALTYGEYDVCGAFSNLSLSSTETNTNITSFVPKILPCLEFYLDLAISLSRCPEESARRIASDLAHMLRCQPMNEQRELFLTTLRSPLLKLKLSQQMLESMMEIDEHGSLTLQDIVYEYFRTDPPRMSLTPPPTPSDSEDEGGPVREDTCGEETWEQILLYLSTLTASYLEVEKGAMKTTLWSRQLNDVTEVDVGAKDRVTLKELPKQVERLRQRIIQQTKGLSPKLDSYLIRIECLADLAWS